MAGAAGTRGQVGAAGGDGDGATGGRAGGRTDRGSGRVGWAGRARRQRADGQTDGGGARSGWGGGVCVVAGQPGRAGRTDRRAEGQTENAQGRRGDGEAACWTDGQTDEAPIPGSVPTPGCPLAPLTRQARSSVGQSGGTARPPLGGPGTGTHPLGLGAALVPWGCARPRSLGTAGDPSPCPATPCTNTHTCVALGVQAPVGVRVGLRTAVHAWQQHGTRVCTRVSPVCVCVRVCVRALTFGGVEAPRSPPVLGVVVHEHVVGHGQHVAVHVHSRRHDHLRDPPSAPPPPPAPQGGGAAVGRMGLVPVPVGTPQGALPRVRRPPEGSRGHLWCPLCLWARHRCHACPPAPPDVCANTYHMCA